MTYLIRGLGFQKRMRNYLYKDNSARIYMLFEFYRTAIICFIIEQIGCLLGTGVKRATSSYNDRQYTDKKIKDVRKQYHSNKNYIMTDCG